MRLAAGIGLAAVVAVTAPALGQRGSEMPAGDWRTIHRDAAATRFSPLDDINKSNVGSLGQAWTYALKGFNSAVPLDIDGTMYVTAELKPFRA